MKKILILTAALLTASITLLGQTTHEFIQQDPNRAACTMYTYHPLDTAVTAAPKGYEPFYISHIGRHGSRYNTGSDRLRGAKELRAAHEAGNLTPEGEEVLAVIEQMLADGNGKWGLLTEKGAQEHRGISGRMYRHYSSVFSNPERQHVIVYSTDVNRVMKSRDAFLGKLEAYAPDLQVEQHLSKDKNIPDANTEVRGYRIPQADFDRLRKADDRSELHEARKAYPLDATLLRWFKDTTGVKKTLVYDVYDGIKGAQCTDDEALPDINKFFDEDALYYGFIASDYSWFQSSCISNKNEGLNARYGGGGILQMIIRDADAAIAGNDVCANLRFSHDSNVLPLMAIMGIVGYEGALNSEMEEKFRVCENVCMAGNVQMIFYRNKHGKVLVKILKNEKEVLVQGLKPKTGNYYDWTKLKNYFQDRIGELHPEPEHERPEPPHGPRPPKPQNEE